MLKKRYFRGFLTFMMLIILLLVACGSNDSNTETDSDVTVDTESQESDSDLPELGKENLTIPYVVWARETVVSYLIGEVLNDIGYNIDVKQVETGPMWASIADGSADFTASA